MLQIYVEQQKDGSWLADSINLPGSPPVGRGRNNAEAIGDLIVKLASGPDCYRHHHNISIVNMDQPTHQPNNKIQREYLSDVQSEDSEPDALEDSQPAQPAQAGPVSR